VIRDERLRCVFLGAPESLALSAELLHRGEEDAR
jgi:hypothetical protein